MIGMGCALLLVAGAGGGVASGQAAPLRIADVSIRQSVIIRLPARATMRRGPLTRWKERRAPRCMATKLLAGAATPGEDSIDLILRNGDRVRAEFEGACQAVDFYAGFYVLPTADGQLCAGRDAIHLRSGGECAIDRFRRLVPERDRP